MSVLSSLLKKPVKKVTPTRAGAVDLLTPVTVGPVDSGLGASALPPLTAIDALNPSATQSPTAVLATKKPFAETALGKFLGMEGGVAGVAGSVGTVIAAVNGTTAAEKAAAVAAAEQKAAAAAAAEPTTILGLPPFAFAALLLLLLVGVVAVMHKARASG